MERDRAIGRRDGGAPGRRDDSDGHRTMEPSRETSAGSAGMTAHQTALGTQRSGLSVEPQVPNAHGPAPKLSHLSSLLRRINGLHLFRGVLQDSIGDAFLSLLWLLAAENPKSDPVDILEAYAHLFSLLADDTELSGTPWAGNVWQNHLLDRVLTDDNPFTRRAERDPLESMGPSMIEAARNDLAVLEELFLVGSGDLVSETRARLWEGAPRLVSWEDLSPSASRRDEVDGPTAALKLQLAVERGWPSHLEKLARHYATSGVGEFARFRAFRWVGGAGGGHLDGVAYPDPICLEELVEYDLERQLLLQNTEQFVAGFAANNVLLYGDRGTGKSSTIKALLHRYGDRGLRLLEVPKSALSDFPRILALLRRRPERFILFVDDLSFGEQEMAYKELKAALEGSVEARPENVVVYATSNRRHLVQERFSDRMSGDGEMRSWDTHQEKLSLADRFGITLVFALPDQPRYLRIVESLVGQRGLRIDESDLHSRALKWAAHQGGFSGRTARQFVDFLAGELALAESGGVSTGA